MAADFRGRLLFPVQRESTCLFGDGKLIGLGWRIEMEGGREGNAVRVSG